MIEIVRYRFRAPDGKTSPEHLTLEEGAAKYPGWKPWDFTMKVERIREAGDIEDPMPPSLHSFAARKKMD